MKSAFIRKNTKELRDKLEKLGFEICPCTEFENSVWLDICTSNKSIHGVGYLDEDYTGRKTVQEELDFFLYENEKSQDPQEDCGENEDKFLKIAEDIINGKNSI